MFPFPLWGLYLQNDPSYIDKFWIETEHIEWILKLKVSRLRLYKMRVLKYYAETKVLVETWK